MSPDDLVSQREFSKSMLDLHAHVTAQNDWHSKTAELRHASLRNTLDNLEEGMKVLSEAFKDHQVDDRLVERRVTLIEEWQKRLIWIVLAIIPSTITVWESVKKFLFK